MSHPFSPDTCFLHRVTEILWSVLAKIDIRSNHFIFLNQDLMKPRLVSNSQSSKADLELMILLPLPSECWDYRPVPPCQVRCKSGWGWDCSSVGRMLAWHSWCPRLYHQHCINQGVLLMCGVAYTCTPSTQEVEGERSEVHSFFSYIGSLRSP